MGAPGGNAPLTKNAGRAPGGTTRLVAIPTGEPFTSWFAINVPLDSENEGKSFSGDESKV